MNLVSRVSAMLKFPISCFNDKFWEFVRMAVTCPPLSARHSPGAGLFRAGAVGSGLETSNINNFTYLIPFPFIQ